MNVLKQSTSEKIHQHMETFSISELVNNAANVIAPVWPLKTFIAVNPLQGLDDLPFEQAVVEAEFHKEINADGSTGRELVNRELIKWCSIFFDDGQATISMPNRELGFYRAFAQLAPFDGKLNQSTKAKKFLASLPSSPENAILECLYQLGIQSEQREDFIRQSLAALPGWSGYVKWRQNWQTPSSSDKNPASLVDYVAVRCVLTCILWPDVSVAPQRETTKPAYLNGLPEAETIYRQALLHQLVPQVEKLNSTSVSRPDAQLVFCIDVRSEPFRRAIEAQGNYQTLGFAGFFGLPVSVKGYDDDQPHDSCPVLLKPSHHVCEHSLDAKSPCTHRHDRGRSLKRLPKSFYQWLKYNFATPFALAEILGPWLGLRMLARTFAPAILGNISSKVDSAVMPPVATTPGLEQITIEQQANFGEGALRMMGMTKEFGHLIVFCGHGSTTTNNAYASALDCGACGGNHGGSNAKILAAILNNEHVRSILHHRGLTIPADTLFVAAEHDTTTDQMEIYQPIVANAEQLQRLDQLRNDLKQAGVQNAQTRNQTASISSVHDDSAFKLATRRSLDWSEVRPEWGLARNAAFIVGPRELTRQVNLEGRCFLHSYDWKNDDQGKFLTTILTAPMVVAHWINSQYLFSTLDNVAYGSGSKVTQNVVGKLGIMQGNASDLMHGLPLQSVYSSDDQPFHEPQRLLTVVYALRSTIDGIIQSQEVLQKLFGNGWVTLTCLEPSENQAYLLNRDFTWQKA